MLWAICAADVYMHKNIEPAHQINRFLVNRILPLLRRMAALPRPSTSRIVAVFLRSYRVAPSSTTFTPLEKLNDLALCMAKPYNLPKLTIILSAMHGSEGQLLRPDRRSLLRSCASLVRGVTYHTAETK